MRVGDAFDCDVIAKNFSEVTCVIMGDVSALPDPTFMEIISAGRVHLQTEVPPITDFSGPGAKLSDVNPKVSARLGGS